MHIVWTMCYKHSVITDDANSLSVMKNGNWCKHTQSLKRHALMLYKLQLNSSRILHREIRFINKWTNIIWAIDICSKREKMKMECFGSRACLTMAQLRNSENRYSCLKDENRIAVHLFQTDHHTNSENASITAREQKRRSSRFSQMPIQWT